MGNDVTWWKQWKPRHTDDKQYQNDHDSEAEIPGDTNASDIVGRTGEEMPEVAHDEGLGDRPAKAEDADEVSAEPDPS